MPRLIFKCRYLKNAPTHLGNLVEYIATREGVEKIPVFDRTLPVTEKQRRLIADILAQLPDTADLFEYEDYREQPTMANAAEFISAALEQNLDRLSSQEVYVRYIATRPRAEKLGRHGLFSDEDAPLVLSTVAEETSRQSGNVWIPVISLRREDAARLGYDNAAAWMALLRKQRNMFAEQMKIAPENLRWYAAFHNEGHHPHCHMIIYSADPREGYVTKAAIKNMRGSLAREIFRQDLMQIYSEQTVKRNALAEQSRQTLRELVAQMRSGTCENAVMEDLLTQLAERLRHLGGKKQYGYLKAPLKEMVDRIVDELAKDARVAQAYTHWYALRNEVLRTYRDRLPAPLPLSRQKEFKAIKNIVISEAVQIAGGHFTFEGDEAMDESSTETVTVGDSPLPPPETEQPTFMDGKLDEDEEPSPSSAAGKDVPGKPHIAWSDRYQEARVFLYGNAKTEPVFAQALRLFFAEAAAGNALAMHDLGRMYADGLGVEMDGDAAFAWYEKALAAFLDIEANKENRYVKYRIGKMHAAGLGTKQDYGVAAGWFAAARSHKYAQYSLAGLYYRGQGVKQDFETAFDLYRQSAGQHMPYASYELAKMYRDGVGAERNVAEAKRHFEEAFRGFTLLEKESCDDKLLYRLGHMLYTGTGTEKDVDAAVDRFEKAARLGNVHAQYMLAKVYLDRESGREDIEAALRWLNQAAEGGSELAQYALGKLYRDGDRVEKDTAKAMTLFTLSADQDNLYAAYALGKLFLAGEDIPKNMEAALRWLTMAAELGNPYAQYRLGKLYVTGEDAPKDVEAAVKWLTLSAEAGNAYAQYALGKLLLTDTEVSSDREAAVRWLTLAAEQGNIYARFFLDHLDSLHNPSRSLATTRLLHHLSRIFQDEQRRLSGGFGLLDSKLRRRLRQKKIAQGYAPDDHIKQSE